MSEALAPLSTLEKEARLALKPAEAQHEHLAREYRLRRDALEKRFQRDVASGNTAARLISEE